MSTRFAPLRLIAPETIRACFNDSFKDYFIPLQLSAEQFQNKLSAEAIDLSLSFGVFQNDVLAGFILNGIDTIHGIKTAYNAGTGILPAYRGKGLSFSLYGFCIAALQKNAVEKTVLEVFQQNTPAIKTYQKAGFHITRAINSYKGRPTAKHIAAVDIREQAQPDWDWINTASAWQPAWQYNNHTLQRAWQQYKLLVAYEQNKAVAFIIFNPTNGRVAVFGGIPAAETEACLTALFAHTGALYEQDITVVHVGSAAAEGFLQSIGLQAFIYSYEMERPL
jgi:ribosomal protein S18 acetylase RimI-like enzyme